MEFKGSGGPIDGEGGWEETGHDESKSRFEPWAPTEGAVQEEDYIENDDANSTEEQLIEQQPAAEGGDLDDEEEGSSRGWTEISRPEAIASDRWSELVTGWTRHGTEQAMARDGHGVSDQAMQDALDNPELVFTDMKRRTTQWWGRNAIVVLNETGGIVTTWARNQRGWRW